MLFPSVYCPSVKHLDCAPRSPSRVPAPLLFFSFQGLLLMCWLQKVLPLFETQGKGTSMFHNACPCLLVARMWSIWPKMEVLISKSPEGLFPMLCYDFVTENLGSWQNPDMRTCKCAPCMLCKSVTKRTDVGHSWTHEVWGQSHPEGD